MSDTIEVTKTGTNTRLKRMNKYKVVLHNDDKTPMDFVIVQLMQVFNKDIQDAYNITMQVHNNGKGIAGLYSKEIANTKINEVHQAARQFNYPLTLTAEEV